MVAQVFFVAQHDESAAYGLVARFHPNNLQAGFDGVSGSPGGTGNDAVSIAHGQQASPKEGGIFQHDFPCFFHGHALFLSPFCEVSTQFVHLFIGCRVDDLHAVKADAQTFCIFLQFGRIPYQHDFSKPFLRNDSSSLQSSVTVVFRQHNHLLCRFYTSLQFVHKCHSISLLPKY